MAYNLIYAQRDQVLLLPPTLSDWLPSDHLVYQVTDAVEQMDMQPFLNRYNAEGAGQAAFDPALMTALLLYGYCVGERSSRRLERLCYEHVAFRVITGNRQPHFTTIARFRRDHEEALNAVFVKVLELCHKAGLVDLSLVAIDGTKIAANAALAASRDRKWIEEQVSKMLAEAEATDAAEDQQYGEARGDELPGACDDRERRLAKLRAAKKELDDEQRAKDLEFAARLRERAREEQANGKKKRGRKPQPPPVDEKQNVNVTDPESRVMKDSRGYLQGYNAQAVVSKGQIILAADVTQQANDVQQLEPMLESMQNNLEAIGTTGVTGTVLADAGYWSEENAVGRQAFERDLLIATRNRHKQRKEDRDRGTPRGRIPNNATPRERMERRLRTKDGKKKYSRRGVIVEPVFGHVKEVRQGRRFMRRGLVACDSEWKLMATAHNLCKLHRTKVLKRAA
jgi:transposase